MTSIVLNAIFGSKLTPLDILGSEGGLIFDAPKEYLEHGIDLFIVDGPGFQFSYYFSRQGMHFCRNDISILFPKEEIDFSKRDFMKVGIRWNPIEIGVAINGAAKSIPTRPSPTPVEIIKWAREQLFIPKREFSSKEEFGIVINSSIQSIQHKIDKSGAYHGFWDKTHGDRGKIIARTPKRETDVQPILHCFIADQMLHSNVEIIPEYNTGAGNADFLFIGSVASQSPAKLIAELKNSHSRDVEHGYLAQLPTYVDNSESDYGAYCVLCYHGEWFDRPDLSGDSITHRLYDAQKSEIGTSFDSIKIITLDLSKKKSASKA